MRRTEGKEGKGKGHSVHGMVLKSFSRWVFCHRPSFLLIMRGNKVVADQLMLLGQDTVTEIKSGRSKKPKKP